MRLTYINFKQYFRLIYENTFYSSDTKYRSHVVYTGWIIILLFIYPIFASFIWLGFFIDDLFISSARKQPLQSPVFIVGNFRSGSTFLHRFLCKDRKTFAFSTIWEMTICPSLVARKFVKGIEVIDSLLGHPLKKGLTQIEKLIVQKDSMHQLSIFVPEEDESYFFHSITSAFLLFISPTLDSTKNYLMSDTNLPALRKLRDMSYFKGCLKRHMRFHHTSRYYLSKNPCFTSRILSLQEHFSDARFIYLLRDPQEAIPSLIGWFSQVWSTVQKKKTPFPYKLFLMDVIYKWYVDALKESNNFSAEQFKIVRYEDLVSDPTRVVKSIYAWLNTPISDQFNKIILREEISARKWKQGSYQENINDYKLKLKFNKIKTDLENVIAHIPQDKFLK